MISLALILQEIEVNLIITDYCMPEMTGYDLLRKIKASFFFFFSRHQLSFLVGFLLFKPFFLFSLLLNRKSEKKISNLVLQESDSLKDIPVVIMSSENVPSRINR